MSSFVPEELIARQSPEAQAIIRLLLAEIQELKSQLLDVQSQLLKLTPQNSSLPPSSQHPHAKPIPPKSKSPRKRGGQPGHPRHQRVLIPSAECAEVIPLRPHVCSGCGERLRGSDPQPRRHLVWELPVITPVVTEYQQHRGTRPTSRRDLSQTVFWHSKRKRQPLPRTHPHRLRNLSPPKPLDLRLSRHRRPSSLQTTAKPVTAPMLVNDYHSRKLWYFATLMSMASV